MKKNLSILVSVFSVILLIFLFFWHEFESEYFEIVFYSVVCIEILITVLGFMLNSIFEEKENKTDSLQDFFSDTLEGEKSAVKKTEKEKKRILRNCFGRNWKSFAVNSGNGWNPF